MVSIKVINVDDENEIFLGITFQNESCRSYLEFYATDFMFRDFAKELIDFPFGNSKTADFTIGKEYSNWAYYLNIHVSCYDPSGHSVIRTIVNNHGNNVTGYRCEIPIEAEIATINELGKQLLNWIPSKGKSFVFPEE